MKIIMVAGDSNKGKSYTLRNDFFDWLVNQKANEIKRVKRSLKEYEGVFDYKGKTIAIHSPGDSYILIVFAIIKYCHYNVLVLTGNTHKQKSIAKLVNEIKVNNNHYVTIKKSPTTPDNQRVLGEIIAQL